mmetsp:Transcript_78602/g.211032  ORF Transcript_78602/g.211032 Transcript_78602/m.211032 type:complete len:164 (+) Transcript_78602:56-547(+)
MTLCSMLLALAAPALLTQCAEGARATRAESVRKMVAARALEAEGLPDPNCHTGVISTKVEGESQICCAGYCGECSDYPTCMTVRGQNSTNACCKSQVYAMRCGTAPANKCLRSCSESVPPCLMDDDHVYTTTNPDAVTAGVDCNEAVKDWHAHVEAATNPAGQ